MLSIPPIQRQYILHGHFLEELLVEIALDNEAAEFALLQGLFENVFFDGVDADKSIYMYRLRLSNTMATILSLFVHGGVPVRVVKHDAVGAGQVNTDAAASS